MAEKLVKCTVLQKFSVGVEVANKKVVSKSFSPGQVADFSEAQVAKYGSKEGGYNYIVAGVKRVEKEAPAGETKEAKTGKTKGK